MLSDVSVLCFRAIEMKIGLAQLNSNDDIENNFNQISEIVKNAESERPEIIFFPENSLFMRIDPADGVESLEIDHKIFKDLQKISDRSKISLHLTTPIKDNGKVYNATVLIQPSLAIRIVYRKIHLFDIELNGQKPIRESDVFSEGGSVEILNFQDFKIGSSICYDIRFAELYFKYAQAEVDAIVVPAAFLVKTGMAHWESLLRARAIESQCYVIASAQSGEHKSKKNTLTRETFGHSMLIDPWGQVIVEIPDGIGIKFAELDHKIIKNIRNQIPMKSHRRLISKK